MQPGFCVLTTGLLPGKNYFLISIIPANLALMGIANISSIRPATKYIAAIHSE